MANEILLKLNSKKISGKLIFIKNKTKHQIHINFKFPKANQIKKAIFKTNGETYPVISDKSTLNVPGSNGIILIKYKNNKTQSLKLRSASTPNFLIIHESCKKDGLKIRKLVKTSSNAFAGLYCVFSKQNDKLNLHFSMDASAIWYGSNLFESSGKGSRWKLFNIIINEQHKDSKIAWGSKRKKLGLSLNYTELIKLAEHDKAPSFYVGLRFSQLSHSQASESDSSLFTLIDANFSHSFTDNLQAKIGGQFLLSKSQTGEQESPKYLGINLEGNYFFTKSLYSGVGFESLSFSTSQGLTTIDYEAPMLIFGFNRAFKLLNLNMAISYSKPFSSEIEGNKLNLILSLKNFSFAKNWKSKIQIENSKIEGDDPMESGFTSLSIEYGF